MSSRTSTTHVSSSEASTSFAALAPAQPHLISASALDYLLIAAVDALRQSSQVANDRIKAIEKELREADLIPQLSLQPTQKEKERDSRRMSSIGIASVDDKDEEEEAVRTRLETIGIHVGSNFTERLSLNKSIFVDPLDAIKFVCKDIWIACWDKQVDNLRTNHRGVYVLQDNSFKPIARISSWDGKQETVKKAKLYTALPAGIIRGALTRCGFAGTVGTEVSSAGSGMGCTFQVKLPKQG